MTAPPPRLEILEGRLTILAALRAGKRRFGEIVLRRGADPEKVADLLAEARARGVPVRRIDEKEMESLAHGKTHGGAIARCSPRPLTTAAELDALLDARPAPLLAVLDGADDPRTLGHILRSAEAFGVHAVLLRRRAWDFDSTEVSRPSSGAFERMPVALADVPLLERLKARGLPLIACLGNAARTMHETDLKAGAVVVLGGEKRGISGAVRAACTRRMRIPTAPDAASLSLGHAAAVVFAEARRQRTD